MSADTPDGLTEQGLMEALEHAVVVLESGSPDPSVEDYARAAHRVAVEYADARVAAVRERADAPGGLTEQEDAALWTAFASAEAGTPTENAVEEVVERIKSDAYAAGVAAERERADAAEQDAREQSDRADMWCARADAAEAKIATALVALAMSDHEPTNRVWHEQMQRVRTVLGGEATP